EDLQLEGAGQDDVERVVGVRAALPAGAPLLDGAPDVTARTNEGEVDVRGRPAEEHATRVLFGAQRHPRLVRVHHDRVREERVRVDAAGSPDVQGAVE